MNRNTAPLPPDPAARCEGSRGGVAVLFALDREAAPFRRSARQLGGVRVTVTGIGSRAATVAREVVRRDRPRLLVMAGFGGALRPGLAAGDVVEAGEVLGTAGGRWPCAGGSPHVRLLTASRLVATPAEKRALHEQYLADVVDMESALVAAACADAGVPFRAVRAVSDTADTALSSRLVTLLAGGRVSPLRAAAALVRQPCLLGEFARLARDTRWAAGTLAGALHALVRETAPGAFGRPE